MNKIAVRLQALFDRIKVATQRLEKVQESLAYFQPLREHDGETSEKQTSNEEVHLSGKLYLVDVNAVVHSLVQLKNLVLEIEEALPIPLRISEDLGEGVNNRIRYDCGLQLEHFDLVEEIITSLDTLRGTINKYYVSISIEGIASRNDLVPAYIANSEGENQMQMIFGLEQGIEQIETRAYSLRQDIDSALKITKEAKPLILQALGNKGEIET